MVKKENKNEKKIEIKFNFAKSKFSDKIKFFNPSKDTLPRIGIDSKKDIFAASTLLKLRNLATVIAIPDLLTPGIKDKTWKKPIIIADL